MSKIDPETQYQMYVGGQLRENFNIGFFSPGLGPGLSFNTCLEILSGYVKEVPVSANTMHGVLSKIDTLSNENIYTQLLQANDIAAIPVHALLVGSVEENAVNLQEIVKKVRTINSYIYIVAMVDDLERKTGANAKFLASQFELKIQPSLISVYEYWKNREPNK